MIKFLFKGLIRDKNRSLLPVIVVALGVFLSVLAHAWITGIFGQSIEFNANFSTGHMKIMTEAYFQNKNQRPNDLALMNTDQLLSEISRQYPNMEWAERIMFGGLIDVPDEEGETKAQGPASGFGIDLLSEDTKEIQRMNLEQSLKKGDFPSRPGEILISDDFFEKLGVKIGEPVTLISSTMFGGMAFYNFRIAGTVSFGSTVLDRGSIIADITDVRQALNMENATGEILGFLGEAYFYEEKVNRIIEAFNAKYHDPDDAFSPFMVSLRDQSNMALFVDFAGKMGTLISVIFIFAMSLVLWNAGLLGGLRRYGEFGVRLAIGEEKSHVYKTLIYESVMVGIIGSIIGSVIGISLSYYLQNHGFDTSSMMKEASIMMPTVFRAQVTSTSYYLGFIPGVASTTIGSMLAGIGIYRRKTAQLFKELES